MDRTAILTDAIEYIGDLLEEKKKLENELMKIDEENCEKSNLELKSTLLDKSPKDNMSAVKPNQVSSSLAEMAKMEVTEIIEIKHWFVATSVTVHWFVATSVTVSINETFN